MMRTWVLHYCRNNRWKTEDWIYSDHEAAMYWAQNYMDHDAEGVVVEEITGNHKQQGGFLTVASRIQHNTYSKESAWNFKPHDYFKGIRIRERHRKKHRIE